MSNETAYTTYEQAMLTRAALLFGPEAMERIAARRVIVFGVGGVGGWATECLVRSGIHRLTIVDGDRVAPSNANRQLVATSSTIGRPKVEALRDRLLDINPDADITAVFDRYTAATAGAYDLDGYDYVVDAIDSVPDKILLIRRATASSASLVSSMGAACRRDPLQVRVADFWHVKGCPLGATLRHAMRHDGGPVPPPFTCVYSEERPQTLPKGTPALPSIMPVTATFGLALASIILADIAGD